MSDRWRVGVEAYVLGALDEQDRHEFEAHLRGCAECAAAVREVGALPALLDLVPPDLVDRMAARDPVTAGVPRPAAEPVPASVLPGLLWSARRSATLRRRWVVAVTGLAAAVVLALALPASPWSLVPEPERPGVVVALRALQDTSVSASVRLEEVAWGTKMELSCRYDGAGGSPTGSASSTGTGGGQYQDGRTTYSLVVLDDQGTEEQVATWAAVPGRTVTVPAASGRTPDQISSVELRGADGTALMVGWP